MNKVIIHVSALFAGNRNNNGNFNNLGNNTNFWSSTEYLSVRANYLYMINYYKNITIIHWYNELGLSVRCVKD